MYLVWELSYHRLGLNLLALRVWPVPVTTLDPLIIMGPSPSASAARADCFGLCVSLDWSELCRLELDTLKAGFSKCF